MAEDILNKTKKEIVSLFLSLNTAHFKALDELATAKERNAWLAEKLGQNAEDLKTVVDGLNFVAAAIPHNSDFEAFLRRVLQHAACETQETVEEMKATQCWGEIEKE